MLITIEKHPDYTVHDCAGTEIHGVSSFDTETREMLVTLHMGRRKPADFKSGFKPLLMPDPDGSQFPWVPVDIALVLPGSYALDPQGELVK